MTQLFLINVQAVICIPDRQCDVDSFSEELHYGAVKCSLLQCVAKNQFVHELAEIIPGPLYNCRGGAAALLLRIKCHMYTSNTALKITAQW